MKNYINYLRLCTAFFIIMIFVSCSIMHENPIYLLDQNRPGTEPQRFAKNILRSEETDSTYSGIHSSVYFTPDYKEMYYTLLVQSKGTGEFINKIMFIEYSRDKWSKPEVAPFSGKYDDRLLTISADGNKIYFSSNRPVEMKDNQNNGQIWYVEKDNIKWGAPKYLGSFLKTYPNVKSPSFSKNNNIYFFNNFPKDDGLGEILKSSFVQNEYLEPERLGPSVNTANLEAFPNVSPDESFLIFLRLIQAGGTGQYISFKDENGNWTDAQNMGEKINSGGVAFCTSFSPDRKYLFYLLRENDQIKTEGPKKEEGIYWVDAGIIEQYKK